MKPFSKTEIKVTAVVLLVIFFVTLKNLKISERKSRDVQRRDDLAGMYSSLHKFHGDFGFFPPGIDGKIKACKGPKFDESVSKIKINDLNKKDVYLENLTVCEWGRDSLRDLYDDNYLPYRSVIPQDMLKSRGFSYYYVSNTRYFQIYASLEGGYQEIGYSSKILDRKLPCGTKYCNFGRSAFGKTPLDMTIEEYEKELKEHPELDKKLEQERVN